MAVSRNKGGYRSFQYLERGSDYRAFDLAAEVDRVEPYRVPLSADEEARAEVFARDHVMVSLHEHVGVFPARMEDTPAYCREGRMVTAFDGLADCLWDAVFDNLMDGIGSIHSRNGWQWEDVVHDLGMRLCDLDHQDFLIHCKRVDDITGAHADGRIAWVASMEGAAMIENDLDRIDILFGLGVRALGITYSEANALG